MIESGDAVDDLKCLIAAEAPHLRRFAIALTGNREQADDLLQDCLERGLRKRRLWRRRGSLRSWLFRILYRLYLDRRRQPTPEVNGSDQIVSLSAAQPASQESEVDCQDVLRALAELPAEQRAAILLVALEGFAYDEAADALGVPIGTLRSRLSRGRETLRRARFGFEPRPKLRRVK